MPESPVSRAQERRRIALRFAAVAAFALALHGRAAGFDFSYLDDNTLILDQQAFLSRPSSIWRSFGRPYLPHADRDHVYYRPLVNASYGIDAQWSGSSPHGYHLTNVVLHALAAGLMLLLLLRFGVRDNVALWGALVFAAHPALTEAVAWIPGRNDVLLTVFALASWLLFLRAGTADGSEQSEQLERLGRREEREISDRPAATRIWITRVGHLLAWLAALFTKEAAIVLPLVFLTHRRFVEPREHQHWRTLMPPWLLGGWIAALGVYLGARAAVAPDGIGAAGVSAANIVGNLPMLVSSLGKLVLPVHLSVLAIPEDTWLWPGALAAVAILAALLAPRTRRAPILFAIGAFVALVAPGLPASNLLILESRLYLPAIAVIACTCAIANQATAWLPERASTGRAPTVAGAAIVVVLAIASFSYAGDFRDRLAFSRAAVRGSPHSALAHRNLGVTYHLAGDTEAARREYEAALAADAGEPIVHNNLAVILMAKGDLAAAERELRQEVAINPRYPDAHANLARVLGAGGRAAEAARHWEIARGLTSPGP